MLRIVAFTVGLLLCAASAQALEWEPFCRADRACVVSVRLAPHSAAHLTSRHTVPAGASITGADFVDGRRTFLDGEAGDHSYSTMDRRGRMSYRISIPLADDGPLRVWVANYSALPHRFTLRFWVPGDWRPG